MKLRITKYDPSYRDERGRYLKPEWTSASDLIDIAPDSAEIAGYIAIEDAYVECALFLAAKGNGAPVQATCLGWTKNDHPVLDSLDALRRVCPADLVEGVPLGPPGIENAVRMALREISWCRLTGENGFYLHFGYDYYMYAGGAFGDQMPSLPSSLMYAEFFESPYRETSD